MYPFQNVTDDLGAVSKIAPIEASETALAIKLIVSAARGRPIARTRIIATAGANVMVSVRKPISFINPPVA
jgi:hypothetical protein